jgi:iron complex outermembrane receptor protein
MNMTRKILATAILAPSFALPAAAQLVLEEVIVTATKRESALMETGIAISAFSSEKLRNQGIDSLDDLSVNTPGMQVSNADRITIRGVGIDSLAFGIDPGVATYFDGMYQRGVGLYRVNNFYDVDRIEVLRGPQGTLYGRNTAGGAVNIISKKPEQEFGGEVNLEAGNEGYTALQGVVNVPLSDRVAWRVSGSKIDRDGLQHNDVGPDVDELDNTTLDTSLRVDWNETWQTDVRLFGYKREGRHNSGYLLQPYDTTTRVFPGSRAVNHTWSWDQENPAVYDESETSHDFANTNDEEFYQALLTNVFDVGDISIKYIGGISNWDNQRDSDVDWSSAELSSSISNRDLEVETQSHELQFISNFDGAFNFIAGLYYYESDEDFSFGFPNAANPIYATPVNWDTELVTLALASETRSDRVPLVTLPGAIMSQAVLGGASAPDYVPDALNRIFWSDAKLEAKSYAAFTQMNYDLTERLTLTGGARYSYDEKDGAEDVNVFVPLSEDFNPIPLGDVTGDGVEDFGVLESETHKAVGESVAYPLNLNKTASGDDDWDNLSGTLRLEYLLESDGFVYASVTSGYRAGGFNLGTNTAEGLDDFSEENVISYEVGYKGSVLDDALKLDMVAYFYDYEDMQVLQNFQDLDTGAGGQEITNAGEAEIYGFEVQANWLVNDHFSLAGSYAYLKTEYTDFVTVDPTSLTNEEVDVSGNSLNRAPENKFSAVASYWLPLGDAGSLTFSGIYSWVDEMYTEPFNTERARLDSWGRTDVRVTWVSAAESLAVTAYVKNIEDEREATDASLGTTEDGFTVRNELTDPRMYGVRLTYSF